MNGVTIDSLGVSVGVDIGQRRDHTAFVVVEKERRAYTVDGKGIKYGGENHFVVRTLERMELGVTYPRITRRLTELDRRLRLLQFYPEFWVDATGVGKPVIDLLRTSGADIKEVYLTGSDQVVKGQWGLLHLGKSLMVSRLQVLLQMERIRLPNTREAAVLTDELLNYEIRVNENANAQFGSFKVGRHDDLATALGLACWNDPAWGQSFMLPPAFKLEGTVF